MALFLALFQYVYNAKKTTLHFVLCLVRFITYFLVLLMIINPSIDKKNTEVIKPNLLVAVDNSSSIKYNSQDKNVLELLSLIQNDEKLANKYALKYYSFGTNLNVLDSLNFNENQSNIALPFQEFSKLYKENSSPVIIISDGNQTVGNSIEYSNYKSPVFSLIVGDTATSEDIYIKQLNSNKSTTIHNKFPVELFINYIGNKAVSKKLNIFYKGKIIYSEQFQFSKSSNVKTATFFLTASEKGIQYYTAKIESLENEQNVINNTKNFSINVIEDKSKIVVLSSILHPDLGMLKKTIESNKQRTVTISTIQNFKGNISDYQLVILYQPSEEFENIFKSIEKSKLNYFVISGLSTDWDFLNNIQTNFSKNIITQSESYQPIFNSNYTSFLSDDIGFSNYAPLEDYFGDVTFSVSSNALLFQQIGTIETKKPLLATFENSNQRVAVLFGENSWRWRMESFKTAQTFEYFDGFIANLIQYLTSNQKNKRLTVSLEPIFYANETIKISASYLDKNFNFDSRAKLWLTISNKDKNFIKKIPFATLETRFVAELSNLVSGEYNYTVSVENQDLTLSGSFKISPFEVEQQFNNANDAALKLLSEHTQGEIYYDNQQAQLLTNLIKDQRFKSVQKETIQKTPLIHWEWILGLILLSLSIEWFVRKYFGKI